MYLGAKPQNGLEETETRVDPFREPIDLLLREGRNDVAYRLLKALQSSQQKNQWVEERLASLHRKWIPRWHFEMLNDPARGQAFSNALAVLDLRDKTVLDIGAGSGILSMLAVRSGARHVYACEMVEPLAEMAAEIVRLNGLAHKITIIPKKSFEVSIGREMPARAQVMLSETIDCGFVGEGFLPSLRHARKYLLEDQALLVPRLVQLCGALVESPNIHRLNHVDRSQGFDVSKMNEFSTQGYFGVRLNNRQHRMMSEVKTLIELDLYRTIPERLSRTVEFEAAKSGRVHGVGFWFKVTLAPGISISNDPDQIDSHWTQAFSSFSRPLAVEKGDHIAIELDFSEHTVNIAPIDLGLRRSVGSVNQSGAGENGWSSLSHEVKVVNGAHSLK